MLGRTFGDFVLKERLGAGGGGEVYLAEQVTLGREAVIKVMNSGGESSDGRDRFLREARLASQLDHPFAAHVYGFGTESDGTLWIAMELVRGMPLDVVVKQQGAIPLSRFVPFFERLCEVVQAAHEQGIIHRDIKPANVMVLSRAGRLLPKLLDLGIAKRGGEVRELQHNQGVDEVSPAIEPERSPLFQTVASGSNTLAGTLNERTASRLAESETLNLTRIGAVIGTPHYMAPEQWADAAMVDARADIYSLSLLAYQAVTGRLPFEGRSIRQLAKAHATTPLPELGESLPEGLHAVLSKGAAKLTEERFATAPELAAAVRAASGIGVEPFVLPQLDDGLRENVLSEGPQPIAEAIALMEAARTPKRQLDALLMVRKVTIRFLATLALAGRARVGAGAPSDAEAVVRLLQKLSLHSLGDDEWLSLAYELCRPFADQATTHPLPELIVFFFADRSEAPSASYSALIELDRLSRLVNDSDEDHVVHAALLKLVPCLSIVLKGVGFFFDYALTVQRQGAERWMGTRRLPRLVQNLAPETPENPANEGVAMLVDSVGLRTLTLAPIAKVLSPGAGLPEEFFFLDGAGRHGARFLALPGPFQHQSEDVWPWFGEHIIELTTTQTAAATAQKPPYKGLTTFSPEDADNYFGREKEAESFANRLRQTPLLAVVGPSGSGKSSFVLAGVLPLLPDGWKAVVSRPGANPFQALAMKLGVKVETLEPSTLLGTLKEHESLLLVIDQFEELVTLCQDATIRESFADALVKLAEDRSGRLRVVVTLRDDFLIKIQQLAPLRARLSSALQLLGTPARQELLRVVTAPAARVGYGFDDDALPGKMVDEVAQYPGALALLSFTASQLWDLRDRHLRQMRNQTYVALGGVGGALAQHAEQTLARMDAEEAKLVREGFRHLVTSQATRAVLNRKEMLEVLGNSSSAHAVLEKLLSARLLVSSEDETGDDRVEIIHEALIVSWPRLVGWLREDAETARLRDALRASAKQWADRGKPPGLLWRKETLAEYRVWRARFPGRLTQIEDEFAATSLREENRARTIRRALVAVAIATLAVGLVIVFHAYREADASAVVAKQRFADMRVEQARLAALDNKPYQTLLFSTEARAMGAAGTTLDYLEKRAKTKLEGERGWANLGEAVKLVASPKGDRLAALSAAGNFKLLSVSDLMTLTEIKSTGNSDLGFGFLADGHSGLLCRDHEVLLVTDDGQAPEVLGKTQGALRGCALSPARNTLATIEAGGRLELWPVEGSHLSEPLRIELETDVPLLKFSPSGDQVLAFHGPRALMKSGSVFAPLVDVRNGALIAKLSTGNDKGQAADFSPDGTQLVIGCLDGVGRLYSTATGQAVGQLTGHADRITDIHFSNDGKRIITAGNDRTVRIWNTSGVIQTSLSHDAPVIAVADLGAGEMLTATSDGTIHRWTVGLTAPAVSFFGHSSTLIGFAQLSRDQFVTSAADGILRLWDMTLTKASRRFDVGDNTFALPSQDEQWVLTGPDLSSFARWRLPSGDLLDRMKVTGCETESNMAMTHAEPLLVASSDGRSVCLMRWASIAPAQRLEGHTGVIRRVEFSPGDEVLASSSSDSMVIVWNVATGSPMARLKHRSPPHGLGFSSDGKRLVSSCDDGSLHVWDWANQTELRSWQAHGNQAMSAVFEEQDHSILSVSRDQQVALWNAETGTLIRRFSGHNAAVQWAHVSPDGLLMASIDNAGALIIWDLAAGWAVDRILTGGGPGDVRWLSGGRLITALGSRPYAFLLTPQSAHPTTNWQCLNALSLSGNVIVPRMSLDNCVSSSQDSVSGTSSHPSKETPGTDNTPPP